MTNKVESSRIEAKETRIGDLFSESFMFKIPIYQRPLSWNTDNFDQLFEDIFDAMNNNEAQYFLGSIILQEIEGKNQYELVDGQQRLSALTILLAVVRESTNNDDLKDKINNSWIYQKEDRFKQIPAVMRIAPWEDLQGLFRKYVYSSDGTNKFIEDFDKGLITFKDTQDPVYHLWEAISTFRSKLEQINDLDYFVTYLLNNVYMVYIKTTGLTSAFRLFSVLNARGLPLSTCDLLKSENLGAIPEDRDRVLYARTWREIEEGLGREELENLIAYIRTIKTREKARLGMYEEYQNLFKNRELEKGAKFIDFLKEMTDIYNEKVFEGQIGVGDAEKRNKYKIIVNMMNEVISFSDWVPPLMRFCHKFKSDEYLLDFLLRLEQKVVIEWAIGFSSTERTTSLNRIIKLIEETGNAEEVVDKLLFFKGDEEAKSTKAKILDFGKKQEICSMLTDRLDDAQFYSMHAGRFARYILLRADMEMWELENFPGYPGTITVEHILPQTPSGDSEWIKIFSEEERKKWTNKLGNLVLLSGRKNSKAQNYDFERKKNVYFKGKSTPFRITQELDDYGQWDINSLEKRHREIMKRIEDILLS
jgi:uncharacterized protein with ParB-like and HNH nuclease domain